MTISLGCDHAGFDYKDAVKALLTERGIEIADFGTHSQESVDYPDFAHPASSLVNEGVASLGILLCGSGNGVAMTANKYEGVRAALCWNKELAALARLHNNANMICIPVRFIEESTALEMVSAFLDTAFEGGRHGRRVDKISLSC